MQTAAQQCLVINSNKYAMHQSQISLYGAIFTAQSMKPDPVKVQALQDLPAPENSEQLQSFLVFRLNQLLAALPPWPCI